MKRTIFNTPILSNLLRGLFRLLFRLSGWRVLGRLPDLPKYVIVGAPHTSNWDFVIFLGFVLSLRGELRFIGKAELFRPPLGRFFYWCGGYPVERSKSQGMVEQMVEAFRANDRFVLAIAPEGTRSKVTEWKTGFYHIARKAGVPVATGYVDSVTKTCGIGPTFTLTDNMEADIQTIKTFFAGKVGIHPHRMSDL
ncbi:MAG: glycerol acyltransferase [Anaerolineaceae bacterium]|nr:MAG: glycerol acyltransferase [Anaerolineaceae bacterium]